MASAIERNSHKGQLVFGIVWLGQLVSFIGSGMTSFALGVWVYQATGSITQFALISFSIVLPSVAFGPLAGALVDRWDRRQVMMISDTGGCLSILSVILLLLFGDLEVWHIYPVVFIGGIFDTLRWPALTAVTTQLVPKEQFGRSSGMLQIIQAGTVLISPLIAGVLISRIGLHGVVSIDFATFIFAIFTLLLVRIPRPATTSDGLAGKGSLLPEAIFGWKYISARAGLLALMIFFSIANFTMQMSEVLFTPLFLSFASPIALGTAMSLGGIGYLLGSFVMSIWGAPRRRVHIVIGSMFLLGLFMALIGLRTSIPLITFSIFMVTFFLPIGFGSSQAIWQSKVAPDVQGRVFAIRQAIVLATPPIAYLMAGPLADQVFEPALVKGVWVGVATNKVHHKDIIVLN